MQPTCSHPNFTLMNVNPETQVAYLAEALTLTTLQALANVDALMSQKPPTHAAAKLRHCAKTLGDLDQTANQTKINTHLLGEQLAVELIILKQRKLSLIQDINACQVSNKRNRGGQNSSVAAKTSLARLLPNSYCRQPLSTISRNFGAKLAAQMRCIAHKKRRN